ncbi:MAG: hypothetical protein RQ732_07805 [Methylophaga sp.]|nr:hypothetical protein [Methylophaga sp.]
MKSHQSATYFGNAGEQWYDHPVHGNVRPATGKSGGCSGFVN